MLEARMEIRSANGNLRSSVKMGTQQKIIEFETKQDEDLF